MAAGNTQRTFVNNLSDRRCCYQHIALPIGKCLVLLGDDAFFGFTKKTSKGLRAGCAGGGSEMNLTGNAKLGASSSSSSKRDAVEPRDAFAEPKMLSCCEPSESSVENIQFEHRRIPNNSPTPLIAAPKVPEASNETANHKLACGKGNLVDQACVAS